MHKDNIYLRILHLENGLAPFDLWINSLDKTVQAKILRRIGRIRLGVFGNWKPVGAGIHELKIDFGPGYRIYFAFKNKGVIIIYGGSKKTQEKDIKKSICLWENHKDAF